MRGIHSRVGRNLESHEPHFTGSGIPQSMPIDSDSLNVHRKDNLADAQHFMVWFLASR